jgi:integrase
LRGKLSAQNSSHLKRVQEDFGEYRAMDLTSERIDRYIEQRLDAGAAKASINRVTQMLGQAYKLAIRRGRLARPPYIRQLNESGNVRQGFFNEKEFVAVLAKLPSDLQDFASWCFATGMRKGEAASLTWGMLQGGELRIPGDICKNRKSRVLPLGSELARIIERRRAARRVVVKGVICMDACEFIFHRGGKPVGEFRKSWHSACVAAGLGKIACPACGSEAKVESVCRKCNQRRKYAGRIFHDFRRSCARRLIRAGVSREAAKRLTGHVSDSMFSRYAIVTNEDVLAAQEKIALSSAQG